METIPIISSGLFAGAAAAVSLAEHPARMSISMPEARKQFNHSYNRLAPFQIAMSLITSVSALTLAYEGVPDRSIYVAAGLGMLAMMPYTVICIFPTNHQLESAEKKEDREVMSLFKKWGKLHAVRTIVSIAAFAALTTAALMKKPAA